MRQLIVPFLPREVRWAFVAMLVGFVFYVSIITVPPETVVDTRPDLIPLDKWRHFLAYAAIGVSLAYATADWQWRQRTLAASVLVITVTYGVGIEVWQATLPSRYFSIGDAYANAIGGLLALSWYVIRPHLDLRPVSKFVRTLLK